MQIVQVFPFLQAGAELKCLGLHYLVAEVIRIKVFLELVDPVNALVIPFDDTLIKVAPDQANELYKYKTLPFLADYCTEVKVTF